MTLRNFQVVILSEAKNLKAMRPFANAQGDNFFKSYYSFELLALSTSLHYMQGIDDHIDQFNAREWGYETPQAVY